MEHFFEFLTNHWAMWAGLFVILALIIREEVSSSANSSQVTPANAVNLINHKNAVVIDLRDKESFKQGHIINAVNKSTDAVIKQKDYQKKSLVLVCQTGQQSQTTLSKLKHEGFENVYSLQGGMKAWSEAELPIAK